jgi:NitT/TauT family transport system substrate-binding protein
MLRNEVSEENDLMTRKLSVFILLLLAACGPQAAPTATPVPLETVKVQLAWVHEYSESPFYAAIENGHFAKQGLSVSLAEGGFGEAGYIEPIEEVLSGEADFALGTSPSILQARADGKPIVAIGAVLQRSPSSLISLAENNITRPSDLVGKTVAVNDGGNMQTYLALLASQGIDPADVNTIPRTDFGIDALLNGDVDVLSGWLINEGVLVQEAGKEPSFILMSDYGVDTYDFVVFTTEDTIKNRREMVQGFMTALSAGITDVVSNPEQAVEFTLKYDPELDKDAQLRRLESAIPLMNVPGIPHGTMQSSVWEATQDVLVSQGILDAPVDLTQAFSLDFVEQEE